VVVVVVGEEVAVAIALAVVAPKTTVKVPRVVCCWSHKYS
jgi:hypothetical protein